MKLSVKTFVQLFILGTCWTIVYALPFIHYILYDPLLEQLGCSNTQLGLLMTIFGLGNIFGAPVGGWLADRFDYKKIFVASIVLNGVLSIIFASHITYATAVGIWLLMAVDVLVMNYPCHIKIVRMLASDADQGKIFGMNESFVGITSTIVNAILLGIFAKLGSSAWGFQVVVYVIGGIALVLAIPTYFVMKDIAKNEAKIATQTKEEKKEKMTGKDFMEIIKNPATWLIGFGIFSVYTCAVSMSYFTPYFTAVMGGTVAVSGFISLVRTYGLRLVGAPIGGWLSDRLHSVSKVLIVVYVIGIISLLTLVGFVNYLTAGVFIFITLVVGTIVYMGKGSYYALVSELEVPRERSASTIGVAAALGFSPDIFLFPLVGFLIDNYGNDGYKYLFILQMAVFALGILGSLYCLHYKKKLHEKKASAAA